MPAAPLSPPHDATPPPPPAAVRHLRVRPAGPADVPLIRELAGRSWHAFYPGMISMPQIHYMLRQMYSPRHLLADMERGAGYFIADLAGPAGGANTARPENSAAAVAAPPTEPIGFLGCDPAPAPGPDAALVLQRLYLLPAFQGHGYGAALLRWLDDHARTLGLHRIRLRVNKHNHRALRAYRRAGYRPVDALVEDIGEGHVMDDFVLQRTLGQGTSPVTHGHA